MTERAFETTGYLNIEEKIDLDRCHTDPIHQAAHIQPHGLFIGFDPDALEVRSCSRNLDDYLVFSPEEILGKTLSDCFKEETLDPIREIVAEGFTFQNDLTVESGGRRFIGRVFSIGGGMGLELEPYQPTEVTDVELLSEQNNVIQMIRESESRDQLFDRITDFVRERGGFDRVMVLKFEDQGHGHVVSDATSDRASSYFDQYFPASDIPEPARRLYRKNDLRYIPRAQYDPVPIIGAGGEMNRDELDLTYSYLRSVPLIHRKYLQNMNVGCTMSVSLMVDGALWGLITCHNLDPHEVDWVIRHLCVRIGRMAATRIERLETREREEIHREVEQFRAKHMQSTSQPNDLFEFLDETREEIMEFLDASGFYMQFDEQTIWFSNETDRRPPTELLDWIQEHLKSEADLTVDSLIQSFDEAWSHSEHFSGILAMNLTQSSDNFCVWFRPEQRSQIKWGGDPRAPVDIDEEELNPRNSFDEWTQTIHGQCEPWDELDHIVANDLLQVFNEIGLEQISRELRDANTELEAQNEQLQSIKEALEDKNKELEMANEKLEELSLYDELTGAPNRRQFDQTMMSEWELLKRNQQGISLMMIDIDHFKEFNDRYGHQTGDECLKSVADALRDCARRESDTVARVGGEEFAVILPDTSLSNARELGERMRSNVEDLEILHESSPIDDVVTISLGIAHYDDLHQQFRDQLIQAADDALYSAKNNGRNQVATAPTE